MVITATKTVIRAVIIIIIIIIIRRRRRRRRRRRQRIHLYTICNKIGFNQTQGEEEEGLNYNM